MTAHSDLHHTAQGTPGRSTMVVDCEGEVEHTPVPQKEPNQDDSLRGMEDQGSHTLLVIGENSFCLASMQPGPTPA